MGNEFKKAFSKDGAATKWMERVPGANLIQAGIHAAAGNKQRARDCAMQKHVPLVGDAVVAGERFVKYMGLWREVGDMTDDENLHARLAQIVYLNYTKPDKRTPHDNGTFISGYVYIRGNPHLGLWYNRKKRHAVISFRGTKFDGSGDMDTNLRKVFSGDDSQFLRSRLQSGTRQLKWLYNEERRLGHRGVTKVTCTGHSLGGCAALAFSRYDDDVDYAHCFNIGATNILKGINIVEESKDFAALCINHKQVRVYQHFIMGDPLSMFSRSWGRNVTQHVYKPPGDKKRFTHSIANFTMMDDDED